MVSSDLSIGILCHPSDGDNLGATSLLNMGLGLDIVCRLLGDLVTLSNGLWVALNFYHGGVVLGLLFSSIVSAGAFLATSRDLFPSTQAVIVRYSILYSFSSLSDMSSLDCIVISLGNPLGTEEWSAIGVNFLGLVLVLANILQESFLDCNSLSFKSWDSELGRDIGDLFKELTLGIRIFFRTLDGILTPLINCGVGSQLPPQLRPW